MAARESFAAGEPPANQRDWRTRAEALTIELASWPSVTGTADERAFAPRLVGLLATLPAFRDRADGIGRIPARDGDSADSVAALVRGSGRQTLVLAGHFDTVGTENYGALQPLACRPLALLAALREELSRADNAEERRAAADFAGDDFLPGRGVCDMKSGLAAGLAVLEAFAADPARAGNLLFVATPDEENRSRGMRAVRDALPRIARDWDLEIAGAINLDASSDLGDGSTGRCIFLGSVGKLLPFAHVIGRPAHAGYPFEGISAALLAAEILREIEVAPELAEAAFGQRIAPPVCLGAKDLRERYDVTLPDRMFLGFNVLTQQRGPADILTLFTEAVRHAVERALAEFAARAERHTGEAHPPTRPAILSFAALRERAGPALGENLLAGDSGDPLTVTPVIVEALVRRVGLEGPAVIVGLASLHYPAVHLDAGDPVHRRLQEAADQAARQTAAEHGTSIAFQHYFAGISDMSFLGSRAADLDVVAVNTPSALFVDKPADDVLSFPVINIGPWGREMHQRLERVHAPYAFAVLPALLDAVVRRFFEPDQASVG